MPTRPSRSRTRCRLRPAAILALVACVAAAGSAVASSPATGTTSTGQELAVSVAHDAPHDPVWVERDVTAGASATLGGAETANIVYVVDVSGSMENAGFNPFQPDVGDCDGDGLIGTALDAACVGLIALNDSLGSAAHVQVGLVAYGAGAKTADVDPAAGHQTFTFPPDADRNGNGVPDMEEVIRSLTTEFTADPRGGIGLFTPDITPGFPEGTDFNAALTHMNAAFASQPSESDTAFFLSDGLEVSVATGSGSPLAAAIAAGTVIHTYGIGGGAANACDGGAALRTIADSTGGTCTEVADPSTLRTVLPATLSALHELRLEVNGSTLASATGPDPVELSLAGVSLAGALRLGPNTLEATAIADDGTTVVASTTLDGIDLGLVPAAAATDLALTNEHSVTATVLGDPAHVAGVPVAFEVAGQNAGSAGSCNPASCETDASGQVTFTYAVPPAASSIGVDAITAAATVGGMTQERTATHEWVGAESQPVAWCLEGVNPAGRVPRAARDASGYNADGHFRLVGDGGLGTAVDVFVVDAGSGTVFGPFASGTNVKYVKAPGANPSQSPGTGAVEWRLTGTGDALVHAVDGTGNASDPVACRVPPSR